MSMKEQLTAQGVSEEILSHIEYDAPDTDELYLGKNIWEKALVSLLAGNNILLSGNKSTGKNVLARNLAEIFGRDIYEISFHNDVTANDLVGDDGILYKCARDGAFGVLDEINMAKSDSLAILHSVMDFRHTLDLGGGNTIKLHPMCRFIGTLNYGYFGTKELNEALVSRFQVITMPNVTTEGIKAVIYSRYPTLQEEALKQLTRFFMTVQTRAITGVISEKAVDLRGLFGALNSIQMGLDIHSALEIGVINKCFDEYEEDLLKTDMKTIFPVNINKEKIFK